MNRLLALAMSAALCWGGAMGCSGGGGGTASSPAGTGGPATTGPAANANDVTLPDGSVRHADGSITYADGSTKLLDGTIILADGTIQKPTDKKPDVTGGPIGGVGPIDITPNTPPVAKVVPVAAISGVADGGIYGPVKLTASASGSQHAVGYAWSLSGPGLSAAQTGSAASFPIQLPAATKADSADSYTLSLTVTSSTQNTDTRSIHFTVSPPALPKIVFDGGLATDNAYPFGTAMKFDAGTSLFASDYQWSIVSPAPIACALSNNGQTCQITPNSVGAYTIKLSAKGVGGESLQVASFPFTVKKDIPVASLAGISDQQNVVGSVSLQGSVTNEYGDPVTYMWTLSKDGIDISQNLANADNVNISDPGSYVATFQAKVGDLLSNTIKSSFKIMNPLQVQIVVASTNVALMSAVPYFTIQPYKVTLQLANPISSDYGTISYQWTVTSPAGSSNPATSSGSSVSVAFDKPGTYVVALTVTPSVGPVATASASTVTKATAIITGMHSGYSYLKRPLTVSAKASTGTPTSYEWKLSDLVSNQLLQDTGAALANDNFGFGPLVYGRYWLQLKVVSDLGAGTPDNVLFNIRTADNQSLLPFKFPMAQQLYQVGPNDVYMGDSSGLAHLGGDGQWIRIKNIPSMAAIWARSSNEVYVASAQMIVKYTAQNSWSLFQNGVPGTITGLAGSADHLAVLVANGLLGSSIYVYDGLNWSKALGDDKVALMAMAPDSSAFAIKSDGTLAAYDATQQPLAPLPMLPAGKNWTALMAVSASEAYMADDAGEIYQFDGTATLIPLKTLPIYNQDYVAPAQQYAKGLWKRGSEVEALTQNSGIYYVDQSSVTEMLAPSGFSVDTVGGGTMALVGNAGLPYNYAKDPVDGVLKWMPLLPQGDAAIMQDVKADDTTSARTSGDTVYILNADTSVNGLPYYLQKITADGVRTMVPVGKPINDLWGFAGEAYYATTDGLFKYDGMAPSPTLLLVTGTDSSKIKTIEGTGKDDFYILNKTQIFHTTVGGKTFTKLLELTPLADGWTIEATGMHVLPSGDLFVGTRSQFNGQDSYRIEHYGPDGGLINGADVTNSGSIAHIVGQDVDHLFAITASNILQYDKNISNWNVVTPAGGPFHFRDVQQTATTLYFESDAATVDYDIASGQMVVSTQPMSFIAQGSPDFVYAGAIYDQNGNPIINGPLTFMRNGPMQ